eukprot:7246999-Lingulodinium_polyedra.AAC.1
MRAEAGGSGQPLGTRAGIPRLAPSGPGGRDGGRVDADLGQRDRAIPGEYLPILRIPLCGV